MLSLKFTHSKISYAEAEMLFYGNEKFQHQNSHSMNTAIHTFQEIIIESSQMLVKQPPGP